MTINHTGMKNEFQQDCYDPKDPYQQNQNQQDPPTTSPQLTIQISPMTNKQPNNDNQYNDYDTTSPWPTTDPLQKNKHQNLSQ